MVFSSIFFLYLFLPVVLGLHFLLPRSARNAWLMIASLGFYAWGEGRYTAVIAASIVMNWLLGMALEKRPPASRRLLLGVGVAANLALIGWFKYAAFLSANLSALAAMAGIALPAIGPVHLPIGISFFTFQAISYLVDVARGDVRAEPSPIAFGMYKSLFPQLIAGPIVRYREVAGEIHDRPVTCGLFADGVRRFACGLGKKVLIANTVAGAADYAFSLPADALSPGLAWYGIACYAIQIYFDFSGYSDMAIGLGAMLGFRFPENFALPYASQSVREFWRRWHMSLSGFFRDYVYIPLGGNRRGALRSALNLGVVFLLCGLWHGASWTFIAWGAFHGAWLAAERLGLDRLVALAPRPLRWAYAMAVVLVGWVLFRADSLAHAGSFLLAMAGRPAVADADDWLAVGDALTRWTLIVALPLAIGWHGSALPALRRALDAAAGRWSAPVMHVAGLGFTLSLLAGATVTLLASGFNPFIYYRF